MNTILHHRFFMGGVSSVLGIVFFWFSYRLFKRLGRRCKGENCGCLKNERIFFICLSEDEPISFRDKKGKLRWWIHCVIKFTISVCEKCGRWELVKIDNSPISVWHVKWVKRGSPDQLRPDQVTLNRIYLAVLDFKHVAKYLESKKEAVIPPVDLGFPSSQWPFRP